MMRIHIMQTNEPLRNCTGGYEIDAYRAWCSILNNACERIKATRGLEIIIGVELEFYLENLTRSECANIIGKCCCEIEAIGVNTFNIHKEVGPRQYEIVLAPSNDVFGLVKNLEQVKYVIEAVALSYGSYATFAARPDFVNPPSSLHIHVNLLDHTGKNCFEKHRGTESETLLMQQSIAGLCRLMNSSMVFFAPDEASYRRFRQPFQVGQYKYCNAPLNVSWGGNNRTVAIRIPASSGHAEARRLEHRVCGADANPYLAIASILIAMSLGIEHKMELTLPKVWGNASDHDECPRLSRSLNEAKSAYWSCDELRGVMGVEI
jgi:glutamine synthetase